MFHAYGLTLCLTFAMSMGARLVLFPRFDPDLVLPVIKKRPPTFLPRGAADLRAPHRGRRRRRGLARGHRRSRSRARWRCRSRSSTPWEKPTGGYLVEGYGLSETSPVLMANPVADNRKPGTVGLPLPGTEVAGRRPRRPDARTCRAGERGELIVRGPQVFSGYWKKPEETAEVFARGGWFRTGDIVTIDDDGFVTIVDRIKELIITGGFNVSPDRGRGRAAPAPASRTSRSSGCRARATARRSWRRSSLDAGRDVDVEALRDVRAREPRAPTRCRAQCSSSTSCPKSLIGKVLRRKVRDALVAEVATETRGGVAMHAVAILGAGFSGIGMAVRLLQAGIDDIVVIERGDEVGGTWRDNTFPGCGVRHPERSVLVLVRPQSGLVAHFPAAGRDPRLPARCRRPVRGHGEDSLRHRARARRLGRGRPDVAAEPRGR